MGGPTRAPDPVSRADNNFEAVPESVPEGSGGTVSDPFPELTLFKRSEPLVPGTDEAASGVRHWQQGNTAGSYFLYYVNGKSAVRVDTDGLWVPPTVHQFLPRKQSGEWDGERLRARGWTNEARYTSALTHVPRPAAVLHFPVWDPASLWQ
eukprot:4969970-Prymnesium_polylepis.1